MSEKPQIPIQISPVLRYATGVNIVGSSEEEIVLLIHSGNQAERFVFSPKHAKRLSLLLQKVVNDYENKYGELKTQLPEQKKTTKSNEVGFKA